MIAKHPSIVCAASLVALSALPAHGQTLSGECTVADPPDRATIGDDQTAMPLSAGFPVDAGQRIETKPDNRIALYLFTDEQPPHAEAAVFVDAETTLRIDTARRGLRVERGTVVVHYLARDPAPLIVASESPRVIPAQAGIQGWARSASGTLRITVGPDGNAAFTLIDGDASVYAGAMAERPQGGTALDPSANNQGAIVAGAVVARADPAAAADARRLIDRLYTARLTSARAGWLRRAISGDIVPSVESPAEVASALTNLTVESSVVQRAAGTVTAPVVTGGVAIQTVAPLTQRLLTGGNAASVLVGVRLERTRIVGNPGTQGGGTVRFNTDVRPPFQLSTRR